MRIILWRSLSAFMRCTILSMISLMVRSVQALVQGGNLEGTMFGSAYGGAGHNLHVAPEDLVVQCACTLEELYMGCVKKVGFERLALGLDGKSVRRVKEEVEVEVRPGYGEGDEVRFKEEGNEGFEYPNSDLVIKIKAVSYTHLTLPTNREV
eukprot:TRINITY_DN9362_c0_g2_i1.p1 TRINITY_DN9362_c0_g2~~TRINITY_DN9362_c0_g2_i1.p1  ORF type:complete len:152 (-),score=37.48 TRINITY_DN9362_c0_g2_i1:12-467(-)